MLHHHTKAPSSGGAQRTEPPILDGETYYLVQELFQLVRDGDAQRLGTLLELGLVPNLRDGKGDSLLMLASYHGRLEATRVLLEHGGDPGLANDRGQTPLMGACFKGEPGIVRLLLEHGADPNQTTPDGKTALMFAAMFDHAEVVRLLLRHGADPRHCAADGTTAMALARAMGASTAGAVLVGQPLGQDRSIHSGDAR